MKQVPWPERCSGGFLLSGRRWLPWVVALTILSGHGRDGLAAARPVDWQPWYAAGGQPAAATGSPHPLRALDGTEMAEVQDRLAAKLARWAPDGSWQLQRQRLQGTRAPASLEVVVVTCEFSDSLLYGRQRPGIPDSRQSEFYYAAHDSMYFDHFFTDIATYFAAASDGQFTLHFTVIDSVAELPRTMAYYGNDPELGERSVQLAADVVDTLDAVVDFSLYDTVILIHAGAGEETDILNNSPEQIYSTYLGPEDFAAAARESLLSTPFLPAHDFPDTVGIRHVLILPETEYQDPLGSFGGYFGSLGVYCFEVGLRLGMLSLSDFTPPGRPDSQGIGEFGLMGYGLFVGAGFIPDQPCAFNKMLMGWLDPYPVDPAGGGIHALTAAEFAAAPLACARVDITGGEYWLLEYRQQDPDGNGIFSFSGDLNGNNIPDFYDADSEAGDGTPTGFFDPATDQREWLTGAEWDFFMSENTARPPGVKGAGSGVYIWHVDEGVIEDAFGQSSNLFNADPQRKGVDLEEADGIQDLDSRQGSPYILGGDDDSFRGEGSRAYGSDHVVGTQFGPQTEPSSETAGGAWTGIFFDQFSNVVLDSTSSNMEQTFILYADTLRFRCGRQPVMAGLPQLAAERMLPDSDLRGSHLLGIDLDGAADDVQEIVVAGREGEVFAFRFDLTEYRDSDGDPGTLAPLASGTDGAGMPVSWNGPAAAGNLAGDERPEIVLTAPGGLYAYFGFDGEEVADGDDDPDSRGLLVPLADCRLPAVLLPRTWDAEGQYDRAAAVVACVVEARLGESYLRFIDGTGADGYPEVNLGARAVRSPPLLMGEDLVVAALDTASGEASLLDITWRPAAGPPALVAQLPLTLPPGALPLTGGTVPVPGDPAGSADFVVVAGWNGGAELLTWQGTEVLQSVIWPADSSPASALAPCFDIPGALSPTARKRMPLAWLASTGLAYAGQDWFGLGSSAGVPWDGWPVRPTPAIQASPLAQAPSPLRAELDTGPVLLFESRDGRLYLYDEQGALRLGWPLSGPAAAAATPLLMDLDRDGQLDLAAVGTFDRITGVDADSVSLQSTTVSRIAVWGQLGAIAQPTAAGTPGWPMWCGFPWRVNGAAGPRTRLTGGSVILGGTHLCYPNPLTEGPLHVRASVLCAASVRVFVYNLEGEEVAASAPISTSGGEPVEVVLPLDGVASGLYLCRLQVECPLGASDGSIVPFAVAR